MKEQTPSLEKLKSPEQEKEIVLNEIHKYLNDFVQETEQSLKGRRFFTKNEIYQMKDRSDSLSSHIWAFLNNNHNIEVKDFPIIESIEMLKKDLLGLEDLTNKITEIEEINKNIYDLLDLSSPNKIKDDKFKVERSKEPKELGKLKEIKNELKIKTMSLCSKIEHLLIAFDTFRSLTAE